MYDQDNMLRIKNKQYLADQFEAYMKDVSSNIYKYLNEIKPDILVVTGHDAYNSKDYDDYKNNININNLRFKINKEDLVNLLNLKLIELEINNTVEQKSEKKPKKVKKQQK